MDSLFRDANTFPDKRNLKSGTSKSLVSLFFFHVKVLYYHIGKRSPKKNRLRSRSNGRDKRRSMGRATRREEYKYKLESERKKILYTVGKVCLVSPSRHLSVLLALPEQQQQHHFETEFCNPCHCLVHLTEKHISGKRTVTDIFMIREHFFQMLPHYVTMQLLDASQLVYFPKSIDRSSYFDVTACCCTVAGGLP